MRSRLNDVSRRGVGVRLARFLVPGLLLGLPVACKTAEPSRPDAPVDPPAVTCKPTDYSGEVEVEYIPDSDELVFKPNNCLRSGGKVRLVNKCPGDTHTRIKGPEGDEPALKLPPGVEADLFFNLPGAHKITVTGCPGKPHDSKTGTLEVGSGEGDVAPAGGG